ncbi:gluconokinase [Microbacterium album]|uniref:Gluconokinase n=1 Tax=Microbacterium album TaxID=2053191 RepID=A0A917IFS4_9MICO|nr:gluconokinase [Microbacterium album]GGH41982.1 gluconokinase [Microbacterium album]
MQNEPSSGSSCAIVVMGVSGAGKSTVAALLADRVGGLYIDADDLHSDDAKRRMARGLPLADEDRAPWLARVADRMSWAVREGHRPVVACSALRRSHRDALRRACASVLFVHLVGSRELLEARLNERAGHFMPKTLLASQLETLEPLEPDESGFRISIHAPVAEIVEAAARRCAVP